MLYHLIFATFWFLTGAISVIALAFYQHKKEDNKTMKEIFSEDQTKWSEEEIRTYFR